MDDFNMQCSLAAVRIKEGVPATIQHGAGADGQTGKAVFQCSGNLISAMNQLQLDKVRPGCCVC
jgi:hypothetical protein